MDDVNLKGDNVLTLHDMSLGTDVNFCNNENPDCVSSEICSVTSLEDSICDGDLSELNVSANLSQENSKECIEDTAASKFVSAGQIRARCSSAKNSSKSVQDTSSFGFTKPSTEECNTDVEMLKNAINSQQKHLVNKNALKKSPGLALRLSENPMCNLEIINGNFDASQRNFSNVNDETTSDGNPHDFDNGHRPQQHPSGSREDLSTHKSRLVDKEREDKLEKIAMIDLLYQRQIESEMNAEVKACPGTHAEAGSPSSHLEMLADPQNPCSSKAKKPNSISDASLGQARKSSKPQKPLFSRFPGRSVNLPSVEDGLSSGNASGDEASCDLDKSEVEEAAHESIKANYPGSVVSLTSKNDFICDRIESSAEHVLRTGEEILQGIEAAAAEELDLELGSLHLAEVVEPARHREGLEKDAGGNVEKGGEVHKSPDAFDVAAEDEVARDLDACEDVLNGNLGAATSEIRTDDIVDNENDKGTVESANDSAAPEMSIDEAVDSTGKQSQHFDPDGKANDTSPGVPLPLDPGFSGVSPPDTGSCRETALNPTGEIPIAEKSNADSFDGKAKIARIEAQHFPRVPLPLIRTGSSTGSPPVSLDLGQKAAPPSSGGATEVFELRPILGIPQRAPQVHRSPSPGSSELRAATKMSSELRTTGSAADRPGLAADRGPGSGAASSRDDVEDAIRDIKSAIMKSRNTRLPSPPRLATEEAAGCLQAEPVWITRQPKDLGRAYARGIHAPSSSATGKNFHGRQEPGGSNARSALHSEEEEEEDEKFSRHEEGYMTKGLLSGGVFK